MQSPVFSPGSKPVDLWSFELCKVVRGGYESHGQAKKAEPKRIILYFLYLFKWVQDTNTCISFRQWLENMVPYL